MIEFALSSMRCGFRSRSFQIVGALGVFLIVVAYLAASFSPRQPMTVALDVGLSFVRASIVLMNLLWIQELLVKEIDRKTVLFSLSYPVSRGDFLVGRFLGIQCLVGLSLLLFALLLLLFVFASGTAYEQSYSPALGLPYWACIGAIWLNAAVVAAVALFVATFSTTSMLPLVIGMAVAIGGQALGPALEFLALGAYGEKTLVSTYGPLLDIVRWVLPDLSRLDWRYGPLYDLPIPTEVVISSVAMGLGYCALMLSLGVIVFSRRQIV